MNKQLNIGWAQTDITPDRPVYVIGQLYSRISSYIHDPLTATCLVLENGEVLSIRKGIIKNPLTNCEGIFYLLISP